MAEKTLAEMVQEVKEFVNCGDSAIPIIKSEINNLYEIMAREKPWPDLEVTLGMAGGSTLSYVSGQAYLSLPPNAAQLLSISNKTGAFALKQRSTRENAEANIARVSTSGRVLWYSVMGLRPQKIPLSTADNLQVSAENAADKGVPVEIIGLRSDIAVEDREEITTDATAPDTTPKDSALVYSAGWSISSISVPSGLNGYIKITEKTDTTKVIAYCTEHQRSPAYFVVVLENPPDASDALTVVYKRAVLPLKSDADRPAIPVSVALVESVRSSLRRFDRQYEQGIFHERQSDRSLKALSSERVSQSPRQFQARPDNSGRNIYRCY